MAQTTNDIPPAEFDKLWNYRQPAETEEKFRAIQAEVRKLGSADLELQLKTQIARCQGLQRQFSAADSTLDEVEAALDSSTSIARIRYLLERGRVRNSSQNVKDAIPLFEAAWNEARAAGEDFHAVDAAHMLGIACQGEQANAWNQKAVTAAEASDDERARKWLGALYNNIGWHYFEAQEFDTSEKWFVKTRDWYASHSLKRGEDIARWSIAKSWRKQGKLAEALELQQTLLAEYKTADNENDGYVYEEIAECLYAMGRQEAAQVYFAKAHELLSPDQWLQANESERLERLKQLSNTDGQ